MTDPITPNELRPPSRATDPSDAEADARAAGLDCLRCGRPIQIAGVEELRTGGNTGATKFFLGEWGELGEGKLPVEVYVCPHCRHIEFRSPA